MPTLKDGFFETIFFNFQTNPCSYVTDIEHQLPNEHPIIRYKLRCCSNNNIKFAYIAKKGLVRLSPNGSIAELNILGKLLSLTTKKEKDISSFFKSNGFLFPLGSGTYEVIDQALLFQIIDRLKMTVELMTAANEITKDYSKIFDLSISLILARSIKFQTSQMSIPYCSCHHSFSDLILNPPTELSVEKQKESFNSDVFHVNDSVYGSDKQVNIQEYYNSLEGSSSLPGRNDSLYQSLLQMYVNSSYDETNKMLTDTFYNYINEIGMIYFKNNRLYYYDKPNLSNLTPQLKKSLIRVANHIVSEEINSNLCGVHPKYNEITMSPAWTVDSLLCAAYFSIFYLKPDLELYRLCENPRCNNYFLVKTTSTRNKYCSPECCNRVSQDRYRKRTREKQEH